MIGIEVQEELQEFKVADRRRIEEIRDVISALEERVNIFHRSRDDTWELISDRVTSEMDRASATLSERVTEVERVVRTQSASPATTAEQSPTYREYCARLEARIEAGFQAFSRDAKLISCGKKHLNLLAVKALTSKIWTLQQPLKLCSSEVFP